METAWSILEFVALLDLLILIGGIGFAAFLWMKGIAPALLRLGNGLARRKIAIFANTEHADSLRKLLVDSNLFSQRNILVVSSPHDIGSAENATLFLVFWHDFVANIDDILARKTDGCALIVYAQQGLGFLPPDQIAKLDAHRHTTVTNFRGRLLNDIVTAMITTSYEKG